MAGVTGRATDCCSQAQEGRYQAQGRRAARWAFNLPRVADPVHAMVAQNQSTAHSTRSGADFASGCCRQGLFDLHDIDPAQVAAYIEPQSGQVPH